MPENRYEPLNETHRRVAEEEEKREAAVRNEHGRYEPLYETHRRVAEEKMTDGRSLTAEQQTPINEAPTFSRERIEADPWTAVYLEIPGDADAALLRYASGVVTQCQGAVADPQGPTVRAFEATDLGKDKTREQNLEQATRRLGELDNRLSVLEAEPRPQRREITPEHDPDSPEARLATREKELQEQVRIGRINSSEMIYQLRRFDNELSVERAAGGASSPDQQRDGASGQRDNPANEPEHDDVQPSQQAEDTRDQSRDDPSQRVPETKVEREAETAEHEIVDRGEMTDARAARLERLRSIDRTIERETRDNESKAHDDNPHSGGRSH